MNHARKRVLLIYSRVGGGHLSAARALAEALEASGEATTRLVDAYVECGRFPVTMFPSLYARLSRQHPHLWSIIYASKASPFDPSSVLGPFLRAGFEELMRKERPDAIVSVLPAVNGLLAAAAGHVGARVEVVLTDWSDVHRFWVARNVTHYTVPSESARGDCIRFGAASRSVEVVGIPVRRAFRDRAERLARMESTSRPFTIVAMVGAEGSPRSLTNVAHLAQIDIDAQLVVVCGRNDELRQEVAALPARVDLRAVGFVDDVAELMCSADVLVTKAGGLTLAEAFCCGVPVIVHDVVPGQETGNLEYVLRERAVENAASPWALAELVVELCRRPDKRMELAERGARLARPDAAERIARGVVERLRAKSGERAAWPPP